MIFASRFLRWVKSRLRVLAAGERPSQTWPVDVAYYAARYGREVMAQGPTRHYAQVGAGTAFDPLPLFDSRFYRAQLGNAVIDDTLLAHYLRDGAAKGLDPSPLFSSRAYLAWNPDVAAAGANPLEHFICCGDAEGRRWIDVEAPVILQTSRAVLEKDPRNPFAARVIAERLSHFFDAGYYRAQMEGQAGEPLQHYLHHGADTRLDPHPMFSASYYCKEVGIVAPPVGMTVLEHYLATDTRGSVSPSLLFDRDDYLKMNPDVRAAGLDPFEHFVRWGDSEGRLPLSLERADIDERIAAVLSESPSHPQALRLYAARMLDAGDAGRALQMLEEKGRSVPAALYQALRGQALQHGGRIEDAIVAYQASVVASPRDPSKVDATVAGMLSREAYRAEMRGAVDLAEAGYKAALSKGLPDPQPIRDRLANLVYERGGRDLAMLLLGMRDAGQATQILELPLSSVFAHGRQGGGAYAEFLPARPIAPISPAFLRPPAVLTSDPGILEAPPFYLATLEGGVAASRCNVILHENSLLCDLAAHPGSGKALFGDRLLERQVIRARFGGRALVEWPVKESMQIERGLMMFGVQSRNFGHWCVEYLPRMLAYDAVEGNEDFPLIIDAGMPRSHLESLDLLNEKRRDIVVLEPDMVVRFGQLAIAPVPAYFPLDGIGGYAYDAVWPRDVLGRLKDKMLASIAARIGEPQTQERRIFISRRAFSSRQLVNETEIGALLTTYGFEVVYPEEMSFLEQIDVFRSAAIVVGSCSSAMSNTLYCPAGTPVIGLIHDEPSFNFRGYASYSDAGGVPMLFVRGASLPGQHSVHAFHRDYRVDPDDLRDALKWAERCLQARAESAAQA
ncbi:glycosyltransferase 61 family protein [Cupriavidus oxalaticus]|uniref:glycosyltransferase 61 family protein n=1 Tax=Cupriavidus oxalaticus TaxID=96344 RepID=UPI004034C420